MATTIIGISINLAISNIRCFDFVCDHLPAKGENNTKGRTKSAEAMGVTSFRSSSESHKMLINMMACFNTLSLTTPRNCVVNNGIHFLILTMVLKLMIYNCYGNDYPRTVNQCGELF